MRYQSTTSFSTSLVLGISFLHPTGRAHTSNPLTTRPAIIPLRNGERVLSLQWIISRNPTTSLRPSVEFIIASIKIAVTVCGRVDRMSVGVLIICYPRTVCTGLLFRHIDFMFVCFFFLLSLPPVTTSLILSLFECLWDDILFVFLCEGLKMRAISRMEWVSDVSERERFAQKASLRLLHHPLSTRRWLCFITLIIIVIKI